MLSSPPSPRAAFDALVAALCDDDRIAFASELTSEEDLSHIVQILVGDAELTVVHELPESTHFAVEADFGPLPVEGRREALMQLLQLNAIAFHDGTALLGVDAETGRVVGRRTYRLEGTRFADLLEDWQRLGEFAATWLDCWFADIEDPAEEPSEPPASLIALRG